LVVGFLSEANTVPGADDRISPFHGLGWKRVLRCALLSAQPFSYVYYMGGNRLSAETVEIQSWNGSASSVELDCSDANLFNLSPD